MCTYFSFVCYLLPPAVKPDSVEAVTDDTLTVLIIATDYNNVIILTSYTFYNHT